MEIYKVRSQRLAGLLMYNGFPLIRIERNKEDTHNTFLYNKSDRLLEIIEAYTKKQNKGE